MTEPIGQPTRATREKPSSWYWPAAGVILLLCGLSLTRDLYRPIAGLHVWGEAHRAWTARVHVRYGLGYTGGWSVWAVGDPPTEDPAKYLDHPQLGRLAMSLDMLVFGVNDWAPRVGRAVRQMIALAIFLLILRGLLPERTALLAGLVMAIVPLTAYFGLPKWTIVFIMAAIYFYLVRLRSLDPGPDPRRWHLWALAASLFLAIQMSWEGFFYAAAILVHYMGLRVARRRPADLKLLSVLIAAPALSMASNFLILLAGRGWNVRELVEIFLWRSGGGSPTNATFVDWLVRFGEFAASNFSFGVLAAALAFLAVWAGAKVVQFARRADAPPGGVREFPHFWVFLLPAAFQLLLLRGALWQHQYWQRPLVPLLAIAAALGVGQLYDAIANYRRRVAVAAAGLVVAAMTVTCAVGTHHYYTWRFRSPQFVNMWRTLNQVIPSDKKLLSWYDFKVSDHPAKGTHYRPSVAWYLNREIDTARTLAEIRRRAATGEYPFYLVPEDPQYANPDATPTRRLLAQLRVRYPVAAQWQSFPGYEIEQWGRTPAFCLFDLRPEARRPADRRSGEQ